MKLNQTCSQLTGVGPHLAAKLAKCGLNTIKDLLFYLPYKYQDRTRITPLCDLRDHDWAVIDGTVRKAHITQGKRMSLQCILEDKSGFIHLRFFHFNQSQRQNLTTGAHLRLFGQARLFNGKLTMVHPEYKVVQTDREIAVEEHLTPIYPATQGLSQTRIRQLIQQALSLFEKSQENIELLPLSLLPNAEFPTIAEAIHFLHTPPPNCQVSLLLEGKHPAQQRLAFEELLSHYLNLRKARAEIKQLTAPACTLKEQLIRQFLTLLPFKLTQAQSRVFQQIQHDLIQPHPMQRLVQGDVGSGKTVVAALAALTAIESGTQVALMAPTEILAEQHAKQFEQWFQSLQLRCCRLMGKQGVKAKREILTTIQQGSVDLIIGTHALFQQQVRFSKLGLVIIDEQHRFGVEQRLELTKKGMDETITPHQLIMTATPIPRTLAMANYADLDISVIDELPPGRTPVQTAVIANAKREQVIERLTFAIMDKAQVYWVCTLIEESESLQCQAAEATAKFLRQVIPTASIGLIHGKMKPKEKEATMSAFKRHEIDLLVATTVIEVGVNVPNASLMIIENPERLGLAQLHQLRGRVGRGSKASHCILLYQAPLSTVAQQRLSVMKETSDGFLIAEQDLKIRGPGEILGTRQTGSIQFKIADLIRDKALYQIIPKTAAQLKQIAPEAITLLIQRWQANKEEFIKS